MSTVTSFLRQVLVLGALTALSQAAVLVNDDFTASTRVGTSGAWTGVDRDGGTSNDYVMALNNTSAANQQGNTNAPRVAAGINGNSLAVTNTGAAYSVSTYFTPAVLSPGDSLSATFNVRTTGFTVLPLTTDGSFRFGFFDSNTGRLPVNANFSGGAGSATGTVFTDDRGYAAFYDTTTSGASTHEIRERIMDPATNGSGVSLFRPAEFSTATGGVVAANVFATDTTYPVTFTVTRAADGNSITVTASFNGISLTFMDTSALTTEFDHFAVFYGSQFGSSGTNGTQFLDDVVVTHTPATAPITRLRVYLIGGQSNADGRAAPASLPASPVNLQQPQSDVPLFYRIEGGAGNLTTLRPGLSETSQFGPEVTMGRTLADGWASETGTRVALIKYANGATNLHVDWKPGGTATTAGDGPEYITFQQTVTGGLAALSAAYPGSAVQLQGMFWMQGESDVVNSYGSQYQANLTSFIADVRATYGADLPFVIGSLSNGQTSLTDTAAEAAQFTLVREAQAAVAAAAPRVTLINTDGYGMNADNLHFDASGQQSLGYAAADTLYAFVPQPVRLLGIDFNRDDAEGSPTQSRFRVISGSASNQAANASSYTKTVGTMQITVSQPDGTKFEFRGANTDTSRAIPGGDVSRSFLVADFIATRKGRLDIQFSGLAAGTYQFRSWHLDPFTGSAFGFAQGVSNATQNTIEARIGGVLMDAVQPTCLGAPGLNTTFIDDSQVPSLDFTFNHDGSPAATIRLEAILTNGTDRFLLLNGFELFALPTP